MDSQGDGRWLNESDREDEPNLTPEQKLWQLERRQANNREEVAKDPQEVSEWEDEINQTQGKIDRQKEEIAREAASIPIVGEEAASGEEAA
jgi:hypothetical protein